MKIIVAVSGGVDSCVMLHQLVAAGEHELVVAHVDHGLRDDSGADARFVQALAAKYDLEFEQTRLSLHSDSEASARAGRWKFLRSVKSERSAHVIATAHHQGDIIETMVINLLRGTNRKGLTSLSETDEIKRPLIDMTKLDVYDYALQHELEWVRDESNLSDKYLRNRVRKYILPQLSVDQHDKLLEIYSNLTQVNAELDSALVAAAQTIVEAVDDTTLRIESKHLSQLPIKLQRELFAHWWYRLSGSPPPDSLQLERMVEAVDRDRTGNIYQLANGIRLKIYREYFELYRI